MCGRGRGDRGEICACGLAKRPASLSVMEAVAAAVVAVVVVGWPGCSGTAMVMVRRTEAAATWTRGESGEIGAERLRGRREI